MEAIGNIKGIVYDVGAGSGVLTARAVPYADFIYSVELDSKVARKTELFLKDFENVNFIKGDVRKLTFNKKADYIICEMLDTALIDEEQVPVINSLLKYLKKDGKVIPCGILNGIEPVYTKAEHICYEENENLLHQTLGPLNIYSKYHFGIYIDPKADFKIQLEISRDGMFNGIKITTFTLITPEIICGPTPMMNPPLIIPAERLKVKRGDIINIKLNYMMGGGLDTIKIGIE